MSETVAFPRGKRKSTTSAKDDTSHPSKKHAPSASTTSADKIEKDFLFGSAASASDLVDTARSKKKSGASSSQHLYDVSPSVVSQLPLGGGGVLPAMITSSGKRIPPKIELLSFSKLAKGTKVLGVIREVTPDYAVVSLPTMLTGFVRRADENDAPLTRILPPVNTVMAFSILSTTTQEVSKKDKANNPNGPVKKRRIELSPWPLHVNAGLNIDEFLKSGHKDDAMMTVRGKITSVEDHGCIVDLGGIASGRQAFLQFDNVAGEYDVDDEDSDEEMEDAVDTNDDTGAKRLLHPGKIYDFCILPSSASQSILQVSLPTQETLTKLRSTPIMAPTISSLQPGMLTEVQVEAHAKNGMCVSFMKGVYRGALDEDHLGGHRGVDDGKKKYLDKDSSDPGMWWKSVFKGKHAKFTARIIAVDTSTKIVRFSINHHILALNGEYASFPHSIGTIVNNAQVIRVDAGIGALLALPSSANAETPHLEELRKLDKEISNNLLSSSDYREAIKVSTAYVHISKSMDNPDSDKKKGKQRKSNNNNRTPDALFARHFSINTRVKALRILSTSNLIDGIASCATAKSIVDAHVLTHADIVPGKIYKDVPVVQLLDSGGVLVDLGIGTKGIIPATHLFDKASHGSLDAGGDLTISGYRQKIRQQKYKVGNKITVRCLTVDPAARQCVLTAKKSLLSNDIEDPIVDYPVDQDRVAAGFLSKVDETGLTVTFYNNVHGRVSSRSLAAELGVEDPRQNYNVGDAIAARVLSCERRRNRTVYDGDDLYYYQLKLSLKTVVEKVDSVSTTQIADGSAIPFAAGSIVMPKRMKVLQIVNCLSRDGTFYSGYAIVSVKSKFFTGLPANSGDSIECKLPFDQLLDSFDGQLSNPPMELDAIGHKMLTVGKRIESEAVILTIPNGFGSLPVVGLRPTLINTIKSATSDDSPVICPSTKSNLFIGKFVCGYVTRIDERFGAFVRFLDGLTGLIPKLKKGLNEKLYDTIYCKVTALDITSAPPKILLKKVTESEATKAKKRIGTSNDMDQIQVGDVVGDVKVVDINFARAKVYIVGNDSAKLRARIHVTMADSLDAKTKLSKKEKQFKEEHKIGKSHPFYNWKVGDVVPGVRCVSTDTRDGIAYVELANRVEPGLPAVVTDPSHLPPGSILSAIVTSASKSLNNHGLWVQVCPGVSGFIPALEVSDDPDILNDLAAKFKVGSRITCCVMEQTGHNKLPVSHLQKDEQDSSKDDHKALFLSVLLVPGETSDEKEAAFKPTKPKRSDVVIGRISKKTVMQGPPSLMMTLRGGFIGRCCITEVSDESDWANMPFGRVFDTKLGAQERNAQQQVVSDSDADHDNDDESDDESDSDEVQSDFPDGKYFKCRVIGNSKSKGTLELSLRESRLRGELVNDTVPKVNDIAHAYVVSTTKKGCFVRLSRSVEGRVILKELSDDFIPDPSAMFPPGRLVVGKIKGVKDAPSSKKGPTTFVDFDMRESVLLASGDRVTIDDIKEFSKYTGVITRVESYGCFCRIDNSDVSGLAHVSECSDSFVKNIHDLYNPGDLVKLVVIKVDREQGRLGFSLKASNFVDDDDSSSDGSDDESEDDSSAIDAMEEDEDSDASSDDENFVAKMAAKMQSGEDDDDSDTESESDSDSEDGSDSDSDDSDDEMEDNDIKTPQAMDTNVGFDWDGAQPKMAAQSGDESSEDDSSSSEDESDDEDTGLKSSHKARKKAAAKKREEEEISRREAALADGTADQNPETAADFERLVAGNPNSSELWIKYMAFHLSLADIESARDVANRAFSRIEFRQEGEKLNVWTALLTLELKYGNEQSLQQTVDRACQHNNPKQVYMRVCELLDKEVDAAASSVGSSDLDSATSRADSMFAKMCKKFKSKKSVWIAHFKYLFKGSRHDEAHKLLKRSLQSLPSYKHVETMSKFAQLEFELGSPERGRTIYNGLLEKHPKRMDLLFVNIDKEVKIGDISKARALFESVVNPVASGKKFNFSDKQMKSLFKKWYRVEEEHGDAESQEHVREEARKFVANSSARK